MDEDNPESLALDDNPAPAQSAMGGILILGQKQITYHDTANSITKILPISPCVFLTYVRVDNEKEEAEENHNYGDGQDIVRYILGDDTGKLHILAILRTPTGSVTGLHLDTIGTTNISSSLVYLNHGLVQVGSQTCDSQLIQILDDPVAISSDAGVIAMDDASGSKVSNHALLDGRNVTYVSVLDELTNLGPIVDFDLVPTTYDTFNIVPKNVTSAQNKQYMAVTISGAQKDGSIRLVRNGVGMVEHAAVELGGIRGMWNIRKSFHDLDDAFLIQSYVGETRILGVVMDTDEDHTVDEDEDEVIVDATQDDASGVGATLAEMTMGGIDSGTSTLFTGNILAGLGSTDAGAELEDHASLVVQITESQIRLIALLPTNSLVASWSPDDGALITVASANGSGQIVVVLRGGKLIYLQVLPTNGSFQIDVVGESDVGREISCIDLQPFECSHEQRNGQEGDEESMDMEDCTSMDVDRNETTSGRPTNKRT